MHMYPIFIFAALLIFVYGLFSHLSEQSPISAAIVFVSVGMIASPLGLDLIEVGLEAPAIRVIAEVTLVLVLFIDATTINLRSLIREKGLPFRLLFIGLPLTMLLGVISAVLLFRQHEPVDDGSYGIHSFSNGCGPGPTGHDEPAGPGEDQGGDQRRKRAERRDRIATDPRLHCRAFRRRNRKYRGGLLDCFHHEAVPFRTAVGCACRMDRRNACRKNFQARVDEPDVSTSGRMVPGDPRLCPGGEIPWQRLHRRVFRRPDAGGTNSLRAGANP